MRLRAMLDPYGKWYEPCEVRCTCGFQQLASTCVEAQRIAWAHDAEHEAGAVKGQLALFGEGPDRPV